MDTSVADSLQSWASRATPDELRTGPQARDLGGWGPVGAAAHDLARSPFFRYLIDIAGNDDGTATDEVHAQMDQAILGGLAEHSRHSSYVSAITRLLVYPLLTARLGRPLEQALRQRSEAGARHDADTTAAAIGAAALQAWLHLCSSRTVREHRLLAFLIDLLDAVPDLAPPMAQALPRVAGLAHEYFGDDDLIVLLHKLSGLPEAEADAGFELALASLRQALGADDQSVFMRSAAEARSGFAAVEAVDEARHDAYAYGAALDAIMAFRRSDPEPLRDAASRLSAAVSQHSAWLSGNYLPTWVWTRTQAEMAWLQLSAVLTTAADTLDETCWYQPNQAIAAFCDAYKAARSFTAGKPPGASNGLELFIQPAIEGVFVRDANRLALLDYALTHDAAFSGDMAAQQLHAAVHAAIASIQDVRPPPEPAEGDDALGKGLSRLPAVLHHFSPTDAAELIAKMPQPLLDRLETTLWNNDVARSVGGNVKVDRKFDELVKELSASSDWPVAGGPFKVLLHQTVLYLVSRYNVGAAMGGERTAFLRSADPGSVLERALQQDYFDWLNQGPLYGAIKPEVINRSHGRVDILVHVQNLSYSVECKRELKDASRDGLRAYLGQAAVYTNTDAALGILLALDLTTPSTGAPDLFSSIWVERVQREREEQPRYIVVARLSANAPDPSATRTPDSLFLQSGVGEYVAKPKSLMHCRRSEYVCQRSVKPPRPRTSAHPGRAGRRCRGCG